MKIHEYQAKEIFSKYGIPVERHTLCRTAAGAVAAYKRMGSDRVVIKAQVLTGGRGKAGGVKLPFDAAFSSPLQRARETAELILRGKNIAVQTDVRLMELGRLVRKTM